MGRELTLHGNASLLNILLVGVGAVSTTLAFVMLIKARRAAGIGVEPTTNSDDGE